MRMRKRKWVEPFLEEENKYLIKEVKETNMPTYLEIGMGMGDFIVASSKDNRDIRYIGLEKDATCCARAIKKAQEEDINNLFIMHGDASKLSEYFKSNSIDRIYLHFSDPWPKKHHHKRRLTFPTFLNIYYDILKDNGEIIFKTDNTLLFEDSIEYFNISKFTIEEIDRDYHKVLRNEPFTAYERRFKELGPINYARLKK